MFAKDLARFLLIGLYIGLLLSPGAIFFASRGGLSFFSALTDWHETRHLIFPFFGLYAFTLVAMQAMIGPNINSLRQLFPKIRDFHRAQGLFAFAFMWLHPLIGGLSIATHLEHGHGVSNLAVFIWMAYIGLAILTASIITAKLASYMRIGWWRNLHRFNYLAFVLVWFHSWFLGTDVQATSLKYVWIFYLVVVTVSVLKRYVIPRLVTKPAQ